MDDLKIVHFVEHLLKLNIMKMKSVWGVFNVLNAVLEYLVKLIQLSVFGMNEQRWTI